MKGPHRVTPVDTARAEKDRRAAEFVQRECEIMEAMGYTLIGLALWASPQLVATKRKYGGLGR